MGDTVNIRMSDSGHANLVITAICEDHIAFVASDNYSVGGTNERPASMSRNDFYHLVASTDSLSITPFEIKQGTTVHSQYGIYTVESVDEDGRLHIRFSDPNSEFPELERFTVSRFDFVTFIAQSSRHGEFHTIPSPLHKIEGFTPNARFTVSINGADVNVIAIRQQGIHFFVRRLDNGELIDFREQDLNDKLRSQIVFEIHVGDQFYLAETLNTDVFDRITDFDGISQGAVLPRIEITGIEGDKIFYTQYGGGKSYPNCSMPISDLIGTIQDCRYVPTRFIHD
jgi:hypothetical protein